MNIIENLSLMIHRCKQWEVEEDITDLVNYLQRVVYPRLGSYAVFLDLIDSLPNEHSLRDDEVTIEILEDYRQLAERAARAKELL